MNWILKHIKVTMYNDHVGFARPHKGIFFANKFLTH